MRTISSQQLESRGKPLVALTSVGVYSPPNRASTSCPPPTPLQKSLSLFLSLPVIRSKSQGYSGLTSVNPRGTVPAVYGNSALILKVVAGTHTHSCVATEKNPFSK